MGEAKSMRIKLNTLNGDSIQHIYSIQIDDILYDFNNSCYYPATFISPGEKDTSRQYSIEGPLMENTAYDLYWHKEYVALLEAMPEVQTVLAKARVLIGERIRRQAKWRAQGKAVQIEREIDGILKAAGVKRG